MGTSKEKQEEWCEVQFICNDCGRELWMTLCYGNPVEEYARHHLCPDCYEQAKRGGLLEQEERPKYEQFPRGENHKPVSASTFISEFIEQMRNPKQ